MADAPRRAPAPPRGTTPAGGQANSDWEHFGAAVDAAAVWAGRYWPRESNEVIVMFRCGTVARVKDGDPEFGGYESGAYAFPDFGPNAAPDAAATVANVMADNARVWAAQKSITSDDRIARAVRCAYAAVLKPGHPYPGVPTAERLVIGTDVVAGGLRLETVFWPKLDPGGRVTSLALVPEGMRRAAAARRASDVAGRLRQYDYMFPEVAAVFTPQGRVWAYAAGGAFVCRGPAPAPPPSE